MIARTPLLSASMNALAGRHVKDQGRQHRLQRKCRGNDTKIDRPAIRRGEHSEGEQDDDAQDSNQLGCHDSPVAMRRVIVIRGSAEKPRVRGYLQASAGHHVDDGP